MNAVLSGKRKSDACGYQKVRNRLSGFLRKRQAQSFIGSLNLQTGEELLFPLSWQRQDTIIPVLEELTLKYPNKSICIIWDNARFHKGKKIRKKLSTTLRRIHLINLPPYAPDHNPQEHVWKYGKEKLANSQRESLEETVQAFESIVMSRNYPYRFWPNYFGFTIVYQKSMQFF